MKLVQRQFLKGSREFEIVDDTVDVRIKSGLKEEKLTVLLTVLNPEPVENGAFLEFHSRVKCGPLLSLIIDKPNAQEFNAFVDELKQRARQAYNAFAGFKSGAVPDGLAANRYEEPPEFDEPKATRNRNPVNLANIDESVRMLQQHLESEDIKPLLSALETLKADPESESCLAHLVQAFDDLGPRQGAVLTYAPYVGILLANRPPDY